MIFILGAMSLLTASQLLDATLLSYSGLRSLPSLPQPTFDRTTALHPTQSSASVPSDADTAYLDAEAAHSIWIEGDAPSTLAAALDGYVTAAEGNLAAAPARARPLRTV